MKVLDVTVKKYDVFVKIQVSFTPKSVTSFRIGTV